VNLASASSTPDIQIKNHPFPVLLYLEWGLLLLALVSGLVLPSPLIRVSHQFSFLTASLIIAFGLMGLRLPVGNIKAIIHTTIALSLILLITFLGMRDSTTEHRLFPFLHLYPFLYIILVIRGCLMFRFRGRLFVAFISFSVFLTIVFQRVVNSNWVETIGLRIPVAWRDIIQSRLQLLNLGFAISSALLLGLVLLFVFLLVNALLAERQSREQVAIANQQLREYALRVESLAMEQERNRIARDIHDSLGHSLTALNLQLEAALKLWQANPERAQTFLQEAKQMGSTALQEVRESVSAMRSDPLQGKGLKEAIVTLIQDFHRNTGIQPTYHLHLPQTLANEVNLTVYRIIQEALTNTSKYANATQVLLQIQSTDTGLRLMIADDGQGFEWSQNQTGFGLQGMRERVLALGGELVIDSMPGCGCQIRVAL
jgi:signal transduction histidine kinase